MASDAANAEQSAPTSFPPVVPLFTAAGRSQDTPPVSRVTAPPAFAAPRTFSSAGQNFRPIKIFF